MILFLLGFDNFALEGSIIRICRDSAVSCEKFGVVGPAEKGEWASVELDVTTNVIEGNLVVLEVPKGPWALCEIRVFRPGGYITDFKY